jgi:hypothetical protein
VPGTQQKPDWNHRWSLRKEAWPTPDGSFREPLPGRPAQVVRLEEVEPFDDPLLGAGLELARRAGLTTVLAHAITGWAIALAQALWDTLALASQTPIVAAPALPTLALAGAIWLALWLVGPAGGRHPAPSSG